MSVFEAVDAGDLERVRSLAAAEPHALRERDAEGVTPILYARYRNRLELVDALRSLTPELDVWEAAAVGDADRVRELLDADASLLDASAPDGFFPLGLAAFFGHEEVVRLLLERGADPRLVARNDRLQVTALHAAAAANHAEIARMVVEAGTPVNATQPGGSTALHAAAQNGNLELVRFLIDHGADRDAQLDDGRTPRDLAADDEVREALA